MAVEQFNFIAQEIPNSLNFAGTVNVTGPTGPGVATGGTTGQILKKNSSSNYDTSWADLGDTDPATFTSRGTVRERVYNVRDYGAVGDGSTDDSAAFVSVNAAIKTAGGGVMYIPPGTYAIASDVKIDARKMTIQGAGMGTTTILNKITTQNTGRGVFYLFNSDTVTPVDYFTMKNLSINLNGAGSGIATVTGLHIRATTIATVVSSRYNVENVEFYGRGIDNTGSLGSIRISGKYTGFAGSLKDIRIKNCVFRDSVATTMSNTNGYAILALTDDLENFTVEGCRFENLYGFTIIRNSTGSVIRGPKNWLITGNYFKNTMANSDFGTGVADISDVYRTGLDGITISNNEFDWGGSQASDVQYYHIAIYKSTNFVVENNVFKNGMAVLAPGISTVTEGDESFSWRFNNNTVYNFVRFGDLDGHIHGEYSNNTFYRIKLGGLFGGYGRHKGSVYIGNFIYDCGYVNPSTITNATTQDYAQAIFTLQTADNVVQDNTIYFGSTSYLKYVYYELSSGVADTKIGTNIYKGNTIMGPNDVSVRSFQLDTEYTHVLQDNTGIKESTINKYDNTTTAGTTPVTLPSTDVVSRNYKADGTLVNQFEVTGAASSTDNAVTRFDGTGGKTVQNSLLIVDDSGNTSTTGMLAVGTSTATKPITVQAAASNQNVLQIKNNSGTDKWHIVNTSGTDLEVVETNVAGNRLRMLAGGNLGVNKAPSSLLDVNGPIALAYAAKTTTYSILATDSTIDCTSGTFTVTLPGAAGCANRIYSIKNTGAGTITLATTSSQTIDGATTKTLGSQYAALTVQSNGSNWIILNQMGTIT